jgi:hypothetical protein
MAESPSSSRPVLMLLSVLVGMNVINGGLGALDVLPAKTVGLIALGTAAVSAGVGFYLQGAVVPVDAVGARLTGDGKMVTGAADPTIQPGTEVVISPADGGSVGEHFRSDPPSTY